MPKGPPPNSLSLPEIERTSHDYHKLAASVNDRLAAFHRWLNELPGKVFVSVVFPGDEPNEKVCVAIGRRSKDSWGLQMGRGVVLSEEDGIPLEDVEDGSLSDRCLAISFLPELLNQFYAKQRSIVEHLQAAHDVFAQLPPTAGGK